MPNYVGWIKQADDLYLPAWLKDNLKDTCTCGSPMRIITMIKDVLQKDVVPIPIVITNLH